FHGFAVLVADVLLTLRAARDHYVPGVGQFGDRFPPPRCFRAVPGDPPEVRALDSLPVPPVPAGVEVEEDSIGLRFKALLSFRMLSSEKFSGSSPSVFIALIWAACSLTWSS